MEKFDLKKRGYLVLGHTNELTSHNLFADNFGLLFIYNGTGSITFGNQTYEYHSGSIFLIKPSVDFKLSSSSDAPILGLLFNELHNEVSRPHRPVNGYESLFHHVQYFFSKAKFVPSFVVPDAVDSESVINLLQLISSEILRNRRSSNDIVKNALFLLINIVSRNFDTARETESEPIYHHQTDKILNYIREHINLNKKIDIKEIESKFKIDMESIDESVIAKTGLSYKKYIVRSKMEFFKSRILKIEIA